MIEFVFFKPDHLEVKAMVVAVAGNTLLLGYILRRMVSLFLIHSRFYFRMASQALFIGYFGTEGMALRTIRHAFEMGMYGGERPRRELGPGLEIYNPCHGSHNEKISLLHCKKFLVPCYPICVLAPPPHAFS